MAATVKRVPRLLGRAAELEVLFGLVDRIPEQSGALVVRGESGIGKTSLLAAASERASDAGVLVLRATGVHAETDLPFSGLHQLLLGLLTGGASLPPGLAQGAAPARVSPSILERFDGLPERQRSGLRSAFGVDADPATNRFVVGLGVLSLLSEAAKERPILCVVDDAHWLDRTSAQTLAFVARRLAAESVVMLFAQQEPSDDLRGLPELLVTGLRAADAHALLSSVVHGSLDERVRERILAETGGNPLGLLELTQGRSPAQLAGGFGLPDGTPDVGSVAGRIEQSFLQRLGALPAQTQLLLLVAAAEPLGDPALMWRAARRLGISYEALEPAATGQLVEVGVRVRFRHGLVRSAAYRAASPGDRRRVHEALAEETDPAADPDRRAWHRAHAAAGPDEEVAAELERSAGRAQARGGVGAGAAFLERAVTLTSDRELRTERALAAARAKFEAAAPDAASDLLAIAELGSLDEAQHARLERLRAQIAFARTGDADVPGLTIGPEAADLLLDAAERLAPLDAELARETYLEAITAAMLSAGANGGQYGLRAVAEAARRAPAAQQPPRPIDLLLDGLALRFTEPYAVAAPSLKLALDAMAGKNDRTQDDPRWLWFACPVAPEPLALEMWDDETWHALATRSLAICRDRGALAELPNALTYRASMHVLAGELDAASVLLDESYAISQATGSVPLRYTSLLLAAWRGREAEALDTIEAGIDDAKARGLERAIGFAYCTTAVLYNGLGRYQKALASARSARTFLPAEGLDDLGPLGWALAELVEAGARAGDREAASDALRQLAERTGACDTDWGLGVEARSRALLSEGEDAERLYREAIERLARTRIRTDLARARLVYGEWLRRAGRRVEARDQLRQAHDAFAAMGAEAFAERARRELLATGEKLRKRVDETRDELTPQEELIASLAREGLTNSEIGAQLFISPRTVEWHLRKVFTKLEIASRRELLQALADREHAASPS
jgi:DNA-binding CsgD family transcriptional regulator